MKPIDAAFVGAVLGIILTTIISMVITKGFDTECSERNPHHITKSINGTCYYSTPYGWILEDKKIPE